MTALGAFLVQDTETFNESRRKLLRLAQRLGFDEIAATRLTTIYSELCRAGLGPRGGVTAEVGLTPQPPGLAISLGFAYRGKVSPPLIAQQFFRPFEAVPGAPSAYRGLLPLPDPAFRPSPEFLEEQRDMLAQPSREELLRDLKNKNAALENEIAERKQAEEALRRSESRILAVLEGQPDALLMIDQNGAVTYLNAQVERTFGYTAEDLMGRSIELLTPAGAQDGDGRNVRGLFRPTRARTGGAEASLNAVTKDGRTLAVDVKLSPITTEQGAQVIVSMRDVTEQRKAQQAVRTLSLVVEQSPVSVVITDRSPLIEYVNAAFCRVTGYTRDEVLGQNPRVLKSGQTPPETFAEMWKALGAGQSWRGVLVNRKKNGDTYWEDSTLVPIHGGGGEITHFAAVKEDITDRMRMEEAVRESEVKYRELVENANSIILKLDPQGRITFFNEFAQKFFGFTAEEIIGRHIVGTIVPGTESTGRDLAGFIRDLIDYPERYSRNENENCTKDGDRVWVGWTNRALLDEATGEPIGVLAIGSDITAQKIAQMQRDEALELISGSIRYASRIQQAVLPPAEALKALFAEYFVLWEPRDVVGGDIYWSVPWGDGTVFVLGDCTGHGVPGAFMTLIVTGALAKALRDVEPGDVAGLVSHTHRLVQTGLNQHTETGASDDGMELGVCYVPADRSRMRFCGARFSLFRLEAGEVTESKGDRRGIGYRGIPLDFPYTAEEIPVRPGQRFFMTTDGLVDQIGGEKRRSFGKRRFADLILAMKDRPLPEHAAAIRAELLAYQGDEKRRDDVSVVGFCLG